MFYVNVSRKLTSARSDFSQISTSKLASENQLRTILKELPYNRNAGKPLATLQYFAKFNFNYNVKALFFLDTP